MAEITPELLSKAYTYSSYRQLLDTLMADGKTTGTQQDEQLVNYARLNLARMNRLDKTFKLSTRQWHQVHQVRTELLFITITEGWCGDAAQIVPVLDKVIAANPVWGHVLVLRDEQPALMDHFLTNGKSRSIPKTIILKRQTLEVIGSWGPRPSAAQALVDQLKAADTPKEQLAEQLHGWYSQDKGASTAEEFIKAVDQALRGKTPFQPSQLAKVLQMKKFLV